LKLINNLMTFSEYIVQKEGMEILIAGSPVDNDDEKRCNGNDYKSRGVRSKFVAFMNKKDKKK